MNIEDLKKQRESILKQRDNSFAVYQQAVGALMLLDHLLSEMEQPGSSVFSNHELASATATDSAELVEASKKDGP